MNEPKKVSGLDSHDMLLLRAAVAGKDIEKVLISLNLIFKNAFQLTKNEEGAEKDAEGETNSS